VRRLHALLLVLGGALFAWLVSSVGPAALWRDAARLGWGVVFVIVAVEGFADLLHTAAWRRCFHDGHRPGLLRLWGPHLAGAAINYVTPTATLGGEVVRGTLVPRDVPPAEVTSSLAVNKLTATLADMLVAIAGVALLLAHAPLSAQAKLGVLGGMALVAAGVAAFLALQRGGRMASLVGRRRSLARLLGRERAERVAHITEEIDARIAAVHAEGQGRVLGSVGLHLLGGGIGALQLFLFLRFVGAPSDALTVITIFAVARGIDLVSFFVPARLGALEGARMFAMSLVGVESSLGLLFSLVLRLEQVVWTGVGFVAYAAMLWQRRRETRVVGATR
jgi:hypothetical protein